jgi:hypothetical protein
MDGHVLNEIFSDPQPVIYAEENGEDIVEQKEYSEDEAAQVEDRLRGLGYL